MKKKLNGFTLVELIVSMALLAILMVMIGLMFRPIGRLLADTTKYTEDRYVIDEMNEIIDSNLKFATGVEIYYDVAGYNDSDSTAAGTALGVYNTRKIEIRNVSEHTFFITALGYDPNEYNINGTTTYTTGRILKYDIDHKSRMVGSKAFYGSGNYFVNLETSSGSPMVASNRLKFTTYAINEKWASADSTADEQLTVLEATFRDHDPDQCLSYTDADSRPVVTNYSTHEVVFVNNPTINVHDGGAGADGVNIMIYYTLPGDV